MAAVLQGLAMQGFSREVLARAGLNFSLLGICFPVGAHCFSNFLLLLVTGFLVGSVVGFRLVGLLVGIFGGLS